MPTGAVVIERHAIIPTNMALSSLRVENETIFDGIWNAFAHKGVKAFHTRVTVAFGRIGNAIGIHHF